MSVRSNIDVRRPSKLERVPSKLERAVSGLRAGAVNRLRAEQSRQVSPAANQQDQSEVSSAPRKEALDTWPLPGLAPMTRVRTSFGDVHAAALRKGDEVLTRSGEYLPILWLNRICLDQHLLDQKPDCNPVIVAAGALGSQMPATEIMMSPRQIICADEKAGLPQAREAASLVSRPGIRRLRETSLSYTMFHVGRAAEVYCEGTYLLFPMDA